MLDPYAAMQPKVLKLTAKELLTLTYTQDKSENLLDFFWRVAALVDARIAEHTPKAKVELATEMTEEEYLAAISA